MKFYELILLLIIAKCCGCPSKNNNQERDIHWVGFFMIETLSTLFFTYRQFTPQNTITYHNALCLSPKILYKHCFQFLSTVLMQNFGVAKRERYGILWYFLEWSIINERVSVMVFHLNFCPTLVFSLLGDWSTFIVIFHSILRSFRNNALKFAQRFINEKVEPVPLAVWFTSYPEF